MFMASTSGQGLSAQDVQAATLFKLCKDLHNRDILPAIFFNFSRSHHVSCSWSCESKRGLAIHVTMNPGSVGGFIPGMGM